jgi:hypothetical protein
MAKRKSGLDPALESLVYGTGGQKLSGGSRFLKGDYLVEVGQIDFDKTSGVLTTEFEIIASSNGEVGMRSTWFNSVRTGRAARFALEYFQRDLKALTLACLGVAKKSEDAKDDEYIDQEALKVCANKYVGTLIRVISVPQKGGECDESGQPYCNIDFLALPSEDWTPEEEEAPSKKAAKKTVKKTAKKAAPVEDDEDEEDEEEEAPPARKRGAKAAPLARKRKAAPVEEEDDEDEDEEDEEEEAPPARKRGAKAAPLARKRTRKPVDEDEDEDEEDEEEEAPPVTNKRRTFRSGK